jgi:hypothetical protein
MGLSRKGAREAKVGNRAHIVAGKCMVDSILLVVFEAAP